MTQSEAYKILGVEAGATPAEIKAAYRRRAMEWHPDKHSGDTLAEIGFRLAKEAYDLLMEGPGAPTEAPQKGKGIPSWVLDVLEKISEDGTREDLSAIVGDPDLATGIQHGLRAALRELAKRRPKK